jgi:D-alanine-D-alanine ligase-like ATP-grasp enzyme
MKLIRKCKKVYSLLGAADYARVDMRLKLWPYVLELNPNPILHRCAGGDWFHASAAHGWEYEFLIQQIIKYAFKRWEQTICKACLAKAGI